MKQSSPSYVNQRNVFWILLCCAPLLIAADSPYQKHIDAIGRMSQAERDHLLNNFKSYQAAPPETVEQVTTFRKTLDEDISRGGTLQQTLDDYMDWLNTISPYDRAALREEKDPGKKVVLVEQILAKKENTSPTLRILPMMLTSGNHSGSNIIDRFLWGKAVSITEFENIITLLKNKMPADLPAQYHEIKTARGIDRAILVLRWWTLKEPDKTWIDDVLMADIKKEIIDDDVLKWVNDKGSTDSKMFLLVTILRSAIFYEIEELARTRELTPDTYDKVLKRTDDRQKLFLSSLTATDTHHFLSNLSVLQDVKEGKITLKSLQLLKDVGEKRLKNFSYRPENGPRGSFRGPPGGPGGPGGERPDMRGKDDRPPGERPPPGFGERGGRDRDRPFPPKPPEDNKPEEKKGDKPAEAPVKPE